MGSIRAVARRVRQVARGLMLAACVVSGAGADAAGLAWQEEAWVEDGAQATIEQVSAPQAKPFHAVEPRTVFPLGPGKTLWLRVKLPERPAGAPRLNLDVPVPLIDSVALYERVPGGHWQMQSAGDSLAVAQWSKPGRYPSFDLAPPAGAPHDLYLRVRHSDPIGFALRIDTAAAMEQTRQGEYLVLGVILGTLVLLTVYCLIQSGIHRDDTYAWYALYAATMTLTMATVTGVSGHWLWDHSPWWADAAQGVLPVALGGVNVLFLRHLCSVSARYPRVDRLALVSGVVMLLLGVVFLFVNEQAQSVIVAASLVGSAALSFVMAVLAWRRHDVVGGWVILAYVPMTATMIVAMLRLYGWLSATWLTLDGTAAAAAAAVPLLLLALNARSRDRHGARTRVNKLTQQDALTGLLSAEAFNHQLKGAVAGAFMRKERSAVAVVEIANLPRIRQFYGDAMAEQCLLRAVIKLHRVARESDPAGRIDTGRFGLILEGVSSREELQERMVRLVASGMVPPRGARIDVTLQFHVACVMLGPQSAAPAVILRKLGRMLKQMSLRTRRPVRFLELGDGRAVSEPPLEESAPPVPPPPGAPLEAGSTAPLTQV